MRIKYSRRARLDIDRIWIYIAKESSDSADRVIDSISVACNLIRRSPYIGRKRDNDLGAGMRSYPCANYLIFYRVKSGTVRVVRVLHGKRDIPAILREQ